jgi:multidrug transporter EmrE-like cation transporter
MTGPWICLTLAIGLEVVATTLLKLSNGFEKWQWGLLSLACYSGCFWVLSPALKAIPIGIAYAIWAGVGITAMTGIGAIFFHQRLGPLQLGFAALIIVGAVGLRLTVEE